MSIFDLIQLVANNIWIYGVPFLLVLTILVFVHEWGHYITAKLCGVHIDEFSIGFGKELYGFTDKSGTRWKFSLIPLGGYVKMFGDTDPASAGHSDQIKSLDNQDNPDNQGSEGSDNAMRSMSDEEKKSAFFAKPVWQRALIVFAGPAINFILAIVLFAGLYAFVGKPVTPSMATGVIIGGAGEEAGFQPHDNVIAINGNPVNRFDQIRRAVMINVGDPVAFTVLRQGQEVNLTAYPNVVTQEDRFGFKHSYGFLGIIGPSNGIDISAITSIDGLPTNNDQFLIAQMIGEKLDTAFHITIPSGQTGEESQDLLVHPLSSNNQDFISHLTQLQENLASSKDENSIGNNSIDNNEQSPQGEITSPTAPQAIYLNIAQGSSEQIITYSMFESIGAALNETWDVTTGTLQALGQIITGSRSATELGGIIRIGAIASDMAQNGLIALISFTAILSINLGLINLFPIPMLDGGHLVFYAAEAIKGKPISERVQEYAFRVGLFVLASVMIFANLNDLVQIIL